MITKNIFIKNTNNIQHIHTCKYDEIEIVRIKLNSNFYTNFFSRIYDIILFPIVM